ncbi:MAG: outer membrane protein FlgP [Pseudomonadota bacterium]|jgi:hypothetical protein|nr:outer membrane protein FlgP [Pseudomonadota bacterium]
MYKAFVTAIAALYLSGCTTFSVESNCSGSGCDGSRMTGAMFGTTSITSRPDCSGNGCTTETSSLGLFAGKVATSNKNKGCNSQAGNCASANAGARPIRLTATGYGASSSFEGYSAGQRRLMAMRASKVDAYRAIAEQIYGVRIKGNTTVGAMVAQQDSFRVYVDAFVRGARVVSVTPMAEGNYETELEIELPDGFAERMIGALACENGGCSGSSCNIKGSVTAGCAHNAGFYYTD